MNAKSTIIAALCGLSLWLVNTPATHAATSVSLAQDAITAEAVGSTPFDIYCEGAGPDAGSEIASEFDGAVFAVGDDRSLAVLTPDQELRIADAHFDAYVGEYLGTIDAGPFAGKNFELGTWGSPNKVLVRIWDDSLYIEFTQNLAWQ